MFDPSLLVRAEDLLQALRMRRLRLCTAESCTGGLISALLTEIAGASDVVERGFVVYSNEAKEAMLAVPHHVIATHGAVSEACARAMAEGALRNARADIAVSVTGIAGPGGGTPDKPVGLVHLACASIDGDTSHRRFVFDNADRHEIRMKSVVAALDLVNFKLRAATRLA